ncbi:hypothetical protein J6590_068303 [Homalodisca vitripennis]|nr:hypothetical protein J6590_068303 [Homalodisca vitripennis]
MLYKVCRRNFVCVLTNTAVGYRYDKQTGKSYCEGWTLREYYSVGVHEQHWKYISSVGVVPVHRQYQALATPPPPKGGLVHAGYIHVLLYTYTPIQRQYQALFL